MSEDLKSGDATSGAAQISPDLSRHALFADVPPDALEALAAVSEIRPVSGGELLVEQGEDADALYFVESGRFRVVVNKVHVVAYIEAGEAIGELAFFAGGKRTADVLATRDSAVLKVSRRAFDDITHTHPSLNEAMLKLVSERLAAATARISSGSTTTPRVIALLPAGDSQLPDGFVSRLAAAFEAVIPDDTAVVALDRATSEAADGAAYQAWLAEQEAKGAYVLVDGSGPEKWSDQICRNADALVMVGRPGMATPDTNQAEEKALRWISEDHRTLLLVRDKASKTISHSAAWIDPRQPKLHHHMALDQDGDFNKVARFLTGRAIGLVLAGGGALGCAHLGVVQALRQADIPIDFIGGASAGAAMGGAIARGM
ncbi:cyclic nucleotide-binding domain-containing protein, partial [Parasphingorhabdus sp.]